MKIFLLGDNGQVGSQIKKLFNKEKLNLISFNKEQLNISDYKKVAIYIKKYEPNIIINAAAYTNVEKAEVETDLSNEINNLSVKNLSCLCNQQKILLIHLSTDFVFDGEKKDAYKEDDFTNPLNMYGKSKNDGEKNIIRISKSFIILRTSWVFSEQKNNFVSKIKDKILNSEDIKVVNDQYGCPTSAYSIANCILSICKQYSITEKIDPGVYHFCGDSSTSWYLFAIEILSLMKKSNILFNDVKIKAITSKNLSTSVNRPKYSVLNCDKIKSDFNISQPDWKKDLIKIVSIKL